MTRPDDEKERQERLHVVMERVDVAADQVMEAAKQGGAARVRAVMAYWFGVLYDEGMHRVRQVEQHSTSLQQLVDRMKASNKLMRARLGDIVKEKDPDENDDD